MTLKYVGMLLTEWSQVCDVVIDIFDGEGQDLDAHTADVRSSDLSHEGGELVTVLVNLLHGQCTWNGISLVVLENYFGKVLTLTSNYNSATLDLNRMILYYCLVRYVYGPKKPYDCLGRFFLSAKASYCRYVTYAVIWQLNMLNDKSDPTQGCIAHHLGIQPLQNFFEAMIVERLEQVVELQSHNRFFLLSCLKRPKIKKLANITFFLSILTGGPYTSVTRMVYF